MAPIVPFPTWPLYRPITWMDYHPDFADEAELQAKVDEAGFDTWVELFAVQAFPHMSGSRPTTAAWMPTGTSVADQVFTLIAQPVLLRR